MSDTTRTADPKTNDVPADLVELADAISNLPTDQRATVDEVMARVMQSARRRRRILSLVQDALSQLRLDMKYLMFDLEATRRERDEYRERLGEDA